jgi:hypothetical protein
MKNSKYITGRLGEPDRTVEVTAMSRGNEAIIRATERGRGSHLALVLGVAIVAGCGGSGAPQPTQDFTMAVSPTEITQQAGSTGTPINIGVTGLNGFSGSVSVSFASLPSGTTTSPALPITIAAGGSQNVTLTIPASTAVGDVNIKVSGTSGTLSHSAPLKLSVTAAKDFSLSVSPAQIAATIGGVSQTFNVSVTGENGFTDLVTMSITGLPAGATTQPAIPFSVAAGGSQDIAVNVPMASAVGIFNLQVGGTSGSASHNTQVGLTVLPVIKTYDTGDMLYLETDTSTETTKMGLRKAWGDSIVEVSLNGTNYVNSDDPGREVQTSLWDGNLNYSGGIGSWNPVEAGDSSFDGSPVLAQQLGIDNLYTKTQPLDWAPYLSGRTAPALDDAYVEKWISVVPGENRVFKVHYKVTHFGTDAHANAMQEFPVVYVNAPFNTYVSYDGDAPWTNAALTHATLQYSCCEYRRSSEQWSAFVDSSGSGITVYVPGQLPTTKGWSPGFVNSFTPIVAFSYDPGAVLESDIYVIAGPVDHARAAVYALNQLPHDASPFPPIGFDGPLNPGVISGTSFSIDGWTYGTSAIADVSVYVDGARIGSATDGLARPDVPQAFPGFGDHTGFQYLLDTTKLSNGPHVFLVKVTDATGKITTLGTISATVSN